MYRPEKKNWQKPPVNCLQNEDFITLLFDGNTKNF